MSRHASRLFFAALAATACGPSKKPPPTDGSPSPAQDGATVEAGSSGASRAPEPPPIEAGPPPAFEGATQEVRETAVLDLLSGGEPATRLPRDAVDDGTPFDPGLRNRVAPSVGSSFFLGNGLRIPGGEVQVGATTATVAVSSAQEVAASLRPRFRACYNLGLQSDPRISGKVLISARISPNGDVASAGASQNTGLPAGVVQCVLRTVRNARFDASGPSGSTLQIPLTFVLLPKD